MEIMENGEGFVATIKTKFLYFDPIFIISSIFAFEQIEGEADHNSQSSIFYRIM